MSCQDMKNSKTVEARSKETADLIFPRQSALLMANKQMENLEIQRRSNEVMTTDLQHSALHHRNFSHPENSSAGSAGSVRKHEQFTRQLSTASTPYSDLPTMRSYTSFPSDYYPDSNADDVFSIDHYLTPKDEHLRKDIFTHDLTAQGPVTYISRRAILAKCAMKNKAQSKCHKSCRLNVSAFVQTLLKIRRRIQTVMRRCHISQLEEITAKERALNQKSLFTGTEVASDDFSQSENKGHSSGDPGPYDLCLPLDSRTEAVGSSHHVNVHVDSGNSSSQLAEFNKRESVKEEQIKSLKLTMIMSEMIETERDYVKSLAYVIENFIPELDRQDIPQALRGQRNAVFGNIEKIYEFHSQYFLPELGKCENCPFRIARCFLKYDQKFYLYGLYNKNKPKSYALMSQYGAAFFMEKQLELGDKLDLSNYLMKPVQRLGKYALLLKELLKECQKLGFEHDDLRYLKAAEEVIRLHLRHVNDLLAMDTLRDCDVNVKEQGRLLRQDKFLVFEGCFRKSFRRVFLFEDLILFTKARPDPEDKKNDICHYKYSLKTGDIGLTGQVGDNRTKFEIWLRKGTKKKTFVLKGPNPETKNVWVQEISSILWKQAFRIRDMHYAEMSAMGIENNTCLYMNPSQDESSYLSVGIHELCRGLRSRKTIAVSPLEDLRINRRRQSSSTSSSDSLSSYDENQIVGILLKKNPKPVHRSLSFRNSSDSGVCTESSETEDFNQVKRKSSETEYFNQVKRKISAITIEQCGPLDTLLSNDSGL